MDNVQNYDFFLFESSFICKLYKYIQQMCKITRGMKRSAQ
jgi:hypothetical protein